MESTEAKASGSSPVKARGNLPSEKSDCSCTSCNKDRPILYTLMDGCHCNVPVCGGCLKQHSYSVRMRGKNAEVTIACLRRQAEKFPFVRNKLHSAPCVQCGLLSKWANVVGDLSYNIPVSTHKFWMGLCIVDHTVEDRKLEETTKLCKFLQQQCRNLTFSKEQVQRAHYFFDQHGYNNPGFHGDIHTLLERLEDAISTVESTASRYYEEHR